MNKLTRIKRQRLPNFFLTPIFPRKKHTYNQLDGSLFGCLNDHDDDGGENVC